MALVACSDIYLLAFIQLPDRVKYKPRHLYSSTILISEGPILNEIPIVFLPLDILMTLVLLTLIVNFHRLQYSLNSIRAFCRSWALSLKITVPSAYRRI